jgi:H+/gluconate symporter-like permease
MLGRAIADIATDDKSNPFRKVFDAIGDPFVALLLAVLLALFTFGYLRGFSPAQVGDMVSGSLLPIAGIVFIIGAGGGFKQVLVAIGIGDAIGKAAAAGGISALLLGWLIAVGIRLATGSATVATVTAAGLMAPLPARLPGTNTARLTVSLEEGAAAAALATAGAAAQLDHDRVDQGGGGQDQQQHGQEGEAGRQGQGAQHRAAEEAERGQEEAEVQGGVRVPVGTAGAPGLGAHHT